MGTTHSLTGHPISKVVCVNSSQSASLHNWGLGAPRGSARCVVLVALVHLPELGEMAVFWGNPALHTVDEHFVGLHRIRDVTQCCCAFSHVDPMICGIHTQALHELEACSAIRECTNDSVVKCTIGAFSLKP